MSISKPSPEGTTDNSPELQLWVEVPKSGSSPSEATECRAKIVSVVPSGLGLSAAHGLRAEALRDCRSPLAGLKAWRRLLGIVCGLAIGVCVVPATHAQNKSPSATPTTAAPLTEQKVIERVTASVDRSLEYLASKQKPDGSWDDCNAGNALTLLAMLGRGHVPGRGQYKEVLQKGRKYLLKT